MWPIEPTELDGIEWVAILSIGLASRKERDIWSLVRPYTNAHRIYIYVYIYIYEARDSSNVFHGRATIRPCYGVKLNGARAESISAGQVAATGNYYLRLRSSKIKWKGPDDFRNRIRVSCCCCYCRSWPYSAPIVHPSRTQRASPPPLRPPEPPRFCSFSGSTWVAWATGPPFFSLSFLSLFVFLFFLHRVGWISTVIEDGTIDLPCTLLQRNFVKFSIRWFDWTLRDAERLVRLVEDRINLGFGTFDSVK